MSDPMFSCQEQSCAEEVSYKADMLRLYDGEPICEGCFDENITWAGGGWLDLPAFIPEFQKEIERLQGNNTTIADFLDSIEGAGYGGMADFEIARDLARTNASSERNSPNDQ